MKLFMALNETEKLEKTKKRRRHDKKYQHTKEKTKQKTLLLCVSIFRDEQY